MSDAAKDWVKRAFTHHRAGETAAAEDLYRRALAEDPNDVNALQLLGVLSLSRGRTDDALDLLARAIKLIADRGDARAQNSPLYNNLGNALAAAGRYREAVVEYRRALELAPEDAEVMTNLGYALAAQNDNQGAIGYLEQALQRVKRPEWLHKLGTYYMAVERVADARAAYLAALELNPRLVPALRDLAVAYAHADQPSDAIAVLERLRETDPADVEVHRMLGEVYRGLSFWRQSAESYRAYLKLVPNSWISLLCLGTVLSNAGEHDEGIACIERAIASDPNSSAIELMELGNALLRAGRDADAQATFLRAGTLRPYISRMAPAGKSRFEAMFLVAPGRGNIPYGYLLAHGDYNRHFVAMVHDQTFDIKAIGAHADVVVNLISDADQGRTILPIAEGLVEVLAKPTINHPRKVALTDRAAMARVLPPMPRSRIPQAVALPGRSLLDDPLPAEAQKLAFPFLARVAGHHTGELFEKVEDAEALRAFVTQRPEDEYYLIEYVDYQSTDGHFRKYRFFCVDGALMPYHLAIGGEWKVHHFRTDMSHQPWMQAEEKVFLANPDSVFGPEQRAVLTKIVETVGLEYMGIDCGLDRDGNVVLFEANATMLLSGNTQNFPYRLPYVREIKAAFDAMLERRARRPRVSAGT